MPSTRDFNPFIPEFLPFLNLDMSTDAKSKSKTESVLALTVRISKSQDFLAAISGSPGDQMFSLTFINSTSIFLNSHLWSKIGIVKRNNT